MPDQRDPEITRLLDQLPAEDSPERFWQELRERAESPPIVSQRRPPRLRRATLVVVIAACCLASLAAGTALGATLLTDQSTPTNSPPPSTHTSTPPNTISFQEAPGWNTIASSIAIGSDQRQRNAWATNGTVATDDSTSGWPTNTLKALQPDQVVVWAALNTSVDTLGQYPARQLPLTLTDGEFKSDQYGGQPARNVSQVGPIYARINDEYVTAYVWFGTNQPSAAAREAADQELGRLAIGVSPRNQ